ncbi:MAG: ABC transporter permease, partial [Candidatus Methanomethylicota archaeon]
MSGIKKYVATRIINYVLVLLIVLSLTYVVMAPIADQALINMWRETLNARLRSDPKLIQSLRAKGITPEEWINEQLEVIKKREGLDKPWYERLPKRVFDMLIFKLGRSHMVRSFAGTRNIADIIFERIPFSVLLFTTSTLILIVLGLLIGLACARKPGSPIDVSFIIYALIGNSLPMWWLAMILVLVFVYYLHLFPPPVEIKAIVARPPPMTNPLDALTYVVNVFYYMSLPLLTIIVVSLGGQVYLMRNIVLTTMTEDFVFVARAKGLPERDVIYKHVLRA